MKSPWHVFDGKNWSPCQGVAVTVVADVAAAAA